jgi:hypothetical protein
MCCVGVSVGVGALTRLLQVVLVPRKGRSTSQNARARHIACNVLKLLNGYQYFLLVQQPGNLWHPYCRPLRNILVVSVRFHILISIFRHLLRFVFLQLLMILRRRRRRHHHHHHHHHLLLPSFSLF